MHINALRGRETQTKKADSRGQGSSWSNEKCRRLVPGTKGRETASRERRGSGELAADAREESRKWERSKKTKN